jgi:hypothetical protein
MREIKFRAWDMRSIKGKMRVVDSLRFLDWIIVNGYGANGVHVQLMQYAGLKDKNGVECYHKDILGDSHGNRYVMEWDDKKACFYLKLVHGITGFSHLTAALVKDKEVIGNIYENPELLEKAS